MLTPTSIARALTIPLALGLLLSACSEDEKPGGGDNLGGDAGDPNPPPLEGEGELPPPSEGEGEGGVNNEGEGEGPGPGEGEGEGGGNGVNCALQLVCGSAPSRAVLPNPLVVTASVILGPDIDAAHLQLQRSQRDPREIRVVACETKNAPDREAVRAVVTLEFPIRENTLRTLAGNLDPVGEWTVTMVGRGNTVFRKTVNVEGAGAFEPEPEETCAGGREGFVGDCGVELTCPVPTQRNPAGFICEDGFCSESGAADIGGAYAVALENVEKACRAATEREVSERNCTEGFPDIAPGEYVENRLEIGPATATIDQDQDNDARLAFSDDPVLSRWSAERSIEGVIVGSTFMGDPEIPSIIAPQGVGNCTHVYFLQAPALTKYGDRVVGRLGMNHLELNCGRGCLSCELAGDLVSPLAE